MSKELDLLLHSLESWNQHDLESYRKLYAAEAMLYGMAPEPITVAMAIETYKAFFTAFPNLQLTVIETLCEGERIAIRYQIAGNQQVTFLDIPAQGRRMNVAGVSFLRFQHGLVIERWNLLDQAAILQQLGS